MFAGAIVAARLLQFGSALVLFGSSLFYLYGFRAGMSDRHSSRWAWPHFNVLVAALGALFGALWWVAAQTALIFEDAGAFNTDAIRTVLTETGFGRVTFLRIALLVVSAVLLVIWPPGKGLWIVQSLLGGAVLATFAWTGHGTFDDGLAGIVHMAGDVFHLLAAGVWIGALVPLSILIVNSTRTQSEANARAASHGLHAFSGVAPAVVSLLVLTGLVNSWFLVGPTRIFALFTTDYGVLLVVKLCLFAAMLGLAAVNRMRLTPLLNAALAQGASAGSSLEMLKRSVLIETVLALAVIFAVSWMGTLEPPASAG